MPQKKLQEKSIYAEYDEDGDGIVSDDELSHIKAIKETETVKKELSTTTYGKIYIDIYGVLCNIFSFTLVFSRKVRGFRCSH